MQVMPGPNFLFGDFRAFYCAGAAVGERANPYVNEPLHDCETHTQPPESAQIRQVTVPAPLPPYALLGFVLLARLPFLIAASIFTVASIAAAHARDLAACGAHWAYAGASRAQEDYLQSL